MELESTARCVLLGGWSYQTKLPKKAEAPGHSQVASTGAVEATPYVKTDKQLEQMLADCRLRHEQSLHSGSATSSVHAEDGSVPAVGPTLLLDVSIEGLPIKATVDTGAQSTIISHSTLHVIGHHETEWTPAAYT